VPGIKQSTQRVT